MKLHSALLAALVAPVLVLPGGDAAAVTESNVVFVLVDDAPDALFADMPSVQRYLVEGGMSFSQYVYNQSLCCPSRATALRGQYNHNTTVVSNSRPNGGYEQFMEAGLEESTVGTWFQAAGYETAYLGKYLNGYPHGGDLPNTHAPAGWSTWFGALNGMFDGFDYTVNDGGTVQRYGTAPKDYFTDVLADESIEFIDNADGPFLLWVNPTAPHNPSTPAPRHVDLFDDARAPRGPAFNEADVTDKPRDIAALPSLTPSEIRKVDSNWRNRLRSVQAVDEMVARIYTALEAKDALDNTYLVFGSDNGYLTGQHRHDGKNTPYLDDSTSQLFVRGPGVEPGSVNSNLVGNVDLAQTFAAMAGVSTPSYVDGRSLLPLLNGEDPRWRRAFLLARGEDVVISYAGLYTRRYTFVEYADGFGEFYDNTIDPAQLENTYDTMDPALRETLAARLADLRDCRADHCRRVESRRLSP